ncbi:MAG: ribonuclease P protein component 1 [Nitrososphaerales archaeon]|jgi:ribonuclease P protein subunit POP4|nr:ribonuclease P protein component 1 [Nitrososphaerales archaeon]
MSAINIMFHELIGLRIVVVKSSVETLNGLSGEVVDETQYTLKVKTNNGLKIIPKSVVTVRIELVDGTFATVDGRKILYRPEDRITRLRRKH